MALNLREWHHGYLGLILIGLGAALWYALPWPWCLVAVPFFVFGGWFAGDDTYQHYRQQKDPDYRSSLHRWFARELYPHPVVRKLNLWLDRIVGKEEA